MMKRKGQATEILIGVIILFVFMLDVVFTGYFLNAVEENTSDVLSADGQTILSDGINDIEFFDDVFPFLLVGVLWLALAVQSFFVEPHPVFFIFNVIATMFVLIVVVVVNNTFSKIINDAVFSGVIGSFPNISTYGTQLPLFAAIGSFIFMGILYSRMRGEQV